MAAEGTHLGGGHASSEGLMAEARWTVRQLDQDVGMARYVGRAPTGQVFAPQIIYQREIYVSLIQCHVEQPLAVEGHSIQ